MATHSVDGEADALLAKWMVVASVFTLGICTAIVPPYGRFVRYIHSVIAVKKRRTSAGQQANSWQLYIEV